jgi:thioesterase domain-containing protein
LLDQSKHESDQAVAEVKPAVGNWKCLVPVQTRGTRPPLFFVVGYIVAEETLQILSRLVAHLGPDQPIYGLKPRWLGGEGEAYNSIQEMASECIAEVRAVQLKGPYLLGGYCVAGVVALEMAQQLLREGEQIGMLALIDTARPTAIRSFLHDARFNIDRGKNMLKVISKIVFAKNGATRRQLIVELLRRKLGRRLEKSDVSVINPRYDVIVRHWRLMHRYRPEPYPGPITLIVCEEWYRLDKYPGWAGVAQGGLDCHELSGDHMALLTVHSPELVRFLFESIARDSVAHPG